jgi:hypothetical protein
VTEVDYRPCICAYFWGLDFAEEHTLTCLCGETLFTKPEGNGWFVQHGVNPEHRSPNYDGGSLIAVCDWIDSVCLLEREALGDAS